MLSVPKFLQRSFTSEKLRENGLLVYELKEPLEKYKLREENTTLFYSFIGEINS